MNRAGRTAQGAARCWLLAACVGAISLLFAYGIILVQASSLPSRSGAVDVARAVLPDATDSPDAAIFLPAIMRTFCVTPTIPADANLFGTVFFDKNGDGQQQTGEPGIYGASVALGTASTSSQCAGIYYFQNIPDGNYTLVATGEGFRYLSESRSDFRPAGDGIQITVSGRTERDVGLMQGFLTLPYGHNTTYDIGEYFDYDPVNGSYLWWNGQQGNGVWRNHVGTDLGVYSNGVPVLAPAPGEVIGLGEDPNGGWGIDARAPDGTIWGTFHVTPTVTLGQIVGRGEMIGYVNFPGGPHVHLDVKLIREGDGLFFLDIDVPLDPGICAEWRFVPGGDPEYVKTECSPGFWTVMNDPQPFD